MKKLLTASLLVVGASSAYAGGNFFQDPFTGDNFWGDVGTNSAVQIFDDLTITGVGHFIKDVTVWEFYGDGQTHHLEIWSERSDMNGSILHSFSNGVVAGPPDPDVRVPIFFDTGGVELDPGTYWLRFHVSHASNFDYYWRNANVGNPNGSGAWAVVGGQGSVMGDFDMAWDINANPVPEPATMAALGLGVALLARRRRK